jgi:hypothetical protein
LLELTAALHVHADELSFENADLCLRAASATAQLIFDQRFAMDGPRARVQRIRLQRNVFAFERHVLA